MHKITFWSALWIAFIASAGCHTAQKTVTAPTVDQPAPTEESLLWRISGNGLKKPSYLFGTIHLIPKNELEFSPGVVNALDRSERIAFEIDMRDLTSIRTQFRMMTKAFMKNGATLKDLLSAEDYQFVRAKMDEKGLGGTMFERMKPMFTSMILTNDEETTGGGLGKNSKMTSVEMELYRMSKKRHIKSAGLETADYQMSVFDSIPYEAQAQMLVDGLRMAEQDTVGGSVNALDEMVAMYKSQNITGMQAMIATDSTGMGDYEDVLLNRRNRNWIPVMRGMMENQPTFFAVGAGHLGGKEGVVALLRKEGFRVEAIR